MARVDGLTEGKVYRLARPDRVSKRELIERGQGYLYLCMKPEGAGMFKSLATGETLAMGFFLDELEEVEG
jgi:hypothetical protein